MGDAPINTFVCLKWGAGYPVADTNILFRALCDLMHGPFRFACITDDPTGLDAGIIALPLPEFTLPRARWTPGMWPKLAAFAPDLFAEGTPVMMLDVDLLVLRDLSPMFDHIRARGGLHIIRDWNDTHERWFPRLFPAKRRSNSSAVGFIAGQQEHLWHRYRADEQAARAAHFNDQNFIHEHAIDRQHWPEGWVHSFKKSLAWHMPVNLVRRVPKPGGYLVAFHGRPELAEVAGAEGARWSGGEKWGLRPVHWVKQYWQRYIP